MKRNIAADAGFKIVIQRVIVQEDGQKYQFR